LPKLPQNVNDIFVFSPPAMRCIENDEFIISGGLMRRSAKPPGELHVLRGARALAAFIFGDEDQWRKVYPLREQLGLFYLRGTICGRPATITARIAEREGRARKAAAEASTL
jgi:hypothetical protein